MTIAPATLTLADFFARPDIDESPAWEFVNGVMTKKPMPQGKHSQLQFMICQAINQAADPLKFAHAFPELRFNLLKRSLVPDVAVFLWDRIPRSNEGEIANQFNLSPDWVIEILSPQQNVTKVMANISYCLDQGSELGWLIDPEDKNVTVFFCDRHPLYFSVTDPEINQAQEPLPTLSGLDLSLSSEQIFNWLKLA